MSLFSCKESVRLMSDSLEGPLSWRQRFVLQGHMLLCPPCARFQRHLRLLREAARRLLHRELPPGHGDDTQLSADARARILRSIEELNNP